MARTFLRQRQGFASTREWLVYGRLRLGLGRQLRAVEPAVRLRPKGFGKPVALRPGTTDCCVFREIFIEGEYDCLLRNALGEVKTVLDLGANIGLFTRYARQHFPDARIVAVEPEEGNARMLAENLGLSGPDLRVTALQACAAGMSRCVSVVSTTGEWGYQMVDGAGAQVAAMRVPEILAGAGISGDVDLLKCDVEGAEKEIFANCADWIGRIRNIMVEIHGDYTAVGLLADIACNGGNFHVVEKVETSGLPTLLFLQREKQS